MVKVFFLQKQFMFTQKEEELTFNNSRNKIRVICFLNGKLFALLLRLFQIKNNHTRNCCCNTGRSSGHSSY